MFGYGSGMRRIEPERAAVWTARRFSSLEGRVHDTAVDFAAGHWRCVVVQRWRRWEMWYPREELDKALSQRRIADTLR